MFYPSLLFILFRERDNAGLNVTCASRVFLVESVVNHGFEVQGRFVSGLTRYNPFTDSPQLSHGSIVWAKLSQQKVHLALPYYPCFSIYCFSSLLLLC